MKIAVITGVFPKVSETFVVNQVQMLSTKSDEVDFYCLRKDASVFSNFNINAEVISSKSKSPKKLKLRILKIYKIFQLLKRKHFWPFLKSLNIVKYGINALNGSQFFKTYLAHFFDINNYDLVQIHFGTTAVNVLPYLKLYSKKIIVSFHGFDAHKFDATYYKELSQLKNVSFTVNSNYLKEKVIKLGFNPIQTYVIPTPVDEGFLNQTNKVINKGNSFKILFVGRLIELKAPDLAIEIVKHFVEETNENVSFEIIGQGDYMQKCIELIRNYKLQSFITIHKDLPHFQVKKLMAQSDVFLFPGRVDSFGRAEAQGLVIQEAQAMALPVLVTSVGGIGEGVQNNKTGFVLNNPSVKDFVEKLKYLVNNPDKAFEIGVNGQNYIRKRFSSVSYLEQYCKTFNLRR